MKSLQSGWVVMLLLALIIGCSQPSSQQVTASENSDAGMAMLDGRAIDAMDQLVPIIDSIGDGADDGVDFDTVRVLVEDDQLLLRVNLNHEIGLQNGSDLMLMLDTDMDATTGGVAGHPGADLVWTFGQRKGEMAIGDLDLDFRQGELGIITAPTVSSDFFEIGIPIDAVIQEHSVFTSESVGVAFAYGSDDRVPDTGFYGASLTNTGAQPAELSVEKTDDDAVRLVVWNILHDGIVERPETFDPVFDALMPDIIVLTEVWDTKAEEAQRLFNEWMPLAEGESWYAAKYGNADVITLSRWPILDGWKIPESRAAAFLMQMPEPWDQPLFLIGAHTPCCGKNEQRQEAVDAFMAFLRDAQLGTGEISLAAGTPVAITGDMNLVGYDEQLTTLVTGQIITEKWGPSFGPDTDGSALTDLFPRHLTDNLVYTWRQDDSSYGPGKLDYIVYTDNEINVAHSFVLDTRRLSDELLAKINLNRDANAEASDHLPVVADLLPR
jgi:endonuclease/exonuclease/phosphatase family metal-dependent hydrolase